MKLCPLEDLDLKDSTYTKQNKKRGISPLLYFIFLILPPNYSLMPFFLLSAIKASASFFDNASSLTESLTLVGRAAELETVVEVPFGRRLIDLFKSTPGPVTPIPED